MLFDALGDQLSDKTRHCSYSAFGNDSSIPPRSLGICAESDNHFREFFYHPALQRIYNYHQAKNVPI